MRRFLCWLGWHRYSWVQFGHTCELWACPCGKVIVQFAEDPHALSQVELLNEWWEKSVKNHVGK